MIKSYLLRKMTGLYISFLILFLQALIIKIILLLSFLFTKRFILIILCFFLIIYSKIVMLVLFLTWITYCFFMILSENYLHA